MTNDSTGRGARPETKGGGVPTLVLGAALGGLWLVLSGHYTPLLLSLGAVCVCLSVWFARRMGLIDREGVFIHLFPGLIGYWAWMVKEIFVSNVQVARIVLSPSLPISPALVHYRASQSTDLGRVLFANSITLTPGTITTEVMGDDLRIHALEWVFVDGVEEGIMDARVVQLEGKRGAAYQKTRARVVDLDHADAEKEEHQGHEEVEAEAGSHEADEANGGGAR